VQEEITLSMASPDTLARVNLTLRLSKGFLTHLDKSQFVADRLPLEIFDDFISENELIWERMRKRKARGQEPLRAKSYYFHLHGEREETDARVLDYDPTKKKFLIEF